MSAPEDTELTERIEEARQQPGQVPHDPEWEAKAVALAALAEKLGSDEEERATAMAYLGPLMDDIWERYNSLRGRAWQSAVIYVPMSAPAVLDGGMVIGLPIARAEQDDVTVEARRP